MEFFVDLDPWPYCRWRVELLFANEDIDPEDPDYLLPKKSQIAALDGFQLWVGWIKALNEAPKMTGEKTKYVNSETHMTREQEREFSIEFEPFHMAYSLLDDDAYGRSVYAMKTLWRIVRNRNFMWMRLIDNMPGYELYYYSATEANEYCLPIEPTGLSSVTLRDVVPKPKEYADASLVRSAKVMTLDCMFRFPQTLDIVDT